MVMKGRTVLALLLMTMIASVLVTLTLADLFIMPGGKAGGARASLSALADGAGEGGGLAKEEEKKLDAVMDLIETKFFREVDREGVVDGAISGMLASLDDPYSVYMEGDTAEHFSQSIEGSFTGIGAEVTMEDGKVVIVSAIKGSPAERAGLLAKDVVVSVNGTPLAGLSLNEAVGKIRGPKGTKAKLQIVRGSAAQPIQLLVVRDDIDVETVYAKLREDGVGVIEIRQFSLHTAERFKEELAKLEKEGMKGLVLDVRNDPGGILPVVIEISQHFVPKGKKIVQVEDREGNREETRSQGGGKPYPLAVLINKGSASASEILAGALQESAGAVLIGENSFGKGTVQVSYNKTLGDGSLVKMTIAKWLTPAGNWIHEKGIKPNIAVPPSPLYTVARLSMEKELKQDMLGDQVKSLQTMLAGLGYKPGRTDGYFSAATVEAVGAFQQEHGLPATGSVDRKTGEAIEKAVVKWLQDDRNDVQLRKAIDEISRKI
ncbi:S41 family peptidase [Paenibacillus sp. GCM10023252]|uniref:S41 family peptidase n=1 Tax=Paenibacillus sp. GCM10023252 TaxID=3252649 RepID=UPI003608CF4A